MKNHLHDAFLSSRAGSLALSEAVANKVLENPSFSELKPNLRKDLVEIVQQELKTSNTEDAFINLESLAAGIIGRMETRLRAFSIHPRDFGHTEIDDELSGLEYF